MLETLHVSGRTGELRRKLELVKQIYMIYAKGVLAKTRETFQDKNALERLGGACGSAGPTEAHKCQNAMTLLQEASSRDSHNATELCDLTVFTVAHRSLSMAVHTESLPEYLVQLLAEDEPAYKRCLPKQWTFGETLVEVQNRKHSDRTLQLFLDRVCCMSAAVPRE